MLCCVNTLLGIFNCVECYVNIVISSSRYVGVVLTTGFPTGTGTGTGTGGTGPSVPVPVPVLSTGGTGTSNFNQF